MRHHAVFIHSPCADGIGSAIMYHLAHTKKSDIVVYLPIDYTKLTCDYVTEALSEASILSFRNESINFSPDQIVFLDICPPYSVVEEIKERNTNSQILIIDHHKGGLDKFPAYQKAVVPYFDVNKSGTSLTADFFKSQIRDYCVFDNIFADVMRVAKLFEIRDLWRSAEEVGERDKKDSEALVAYLMKEYRDFVENSHTNLFENIQALSDFINEQAVVMSSDHLLRNAIFLGNCYVDYNKSLVESFARLAVFPNRQLKNKISDEDFAVVNCPYMFSSNVCSRILEMHPEVKFAIAYCVEPYIAPKGSDTEDTWSQVRLSFRCRDGFNVRPIAEKFGGGGHDKASGAQIIRGPVYLLSYLEEFLR